MRRDARIFVAGHRGMVGSAVVRALSAVGHDNLLLRSRSEVDLRSETAVRGLFEQERPEYVFMCAARVGGILANSTYPVEFLLENVRIQNNVIQSALDFGVEKLLFLGSSCIYPKFAPQPIPEEALLTGPLEPTNEAYALAKIAGVKLCEFISKQHGRRFISAMPTNLYGPNDNYDPQSSHVLPAMLRKFHTAKVAGQPSVTLWGTGSPRREFLHADDLAGACVFLMENYEEPAPINVGTGIDNTIGELAEIVREAVGYKGSIEWDRSKPDGTPRKLLDVSRIHKTGWNHKISLRDGICSVYSEVDKSPWLEDMTR